MARPTPALIAALRRTATRLENTQQYQWGHMGSCNCGHLAQEVTSMSKEDIHQRAMQKYGDWTEQVLDYCPTSGLLMDDLISELLAIGLDTKDLIQLEKLSDTAVLRRLPKHKRFLRHNYRADVVLYINEWARMLEEQWIEQQVLSIMSIEKRTELTSA